MNMSKEQSKELDMAITFAQQSIYDGADFLGEWREWNVYEPTFADDEPRFIGFPQYILCKSGKCRWTANDTESRAIMNTFYEDD